MGWDPLDRASWERAVHRATRGDTVPLAHTVLRDGRHSFFVGRLREATLHFASALELALFPEVQRVKASTGEKPLSTEATLGVLVNEATRLGISLPEALQQSKAGFVARRNAAVHNAETPSRDDVLADSRALPAWSTPLCRSDGRLQGPLW